MSIRVAIAGSTGRMGRVLIDEVLTDASLTLSAALERPEHILIGRDPGDWSGVSTTIQISAASRKSLESTQVLIDFTRPKATLRHLELCRDLNIPMVIGTTGFSPDERETIFKASETIAIMMAPNMSVGVNVTLSLLDLAARLLTEGFDVEITEAHHRHKVDAPSGTALRLGEVVAHARGVKLADVALYGREGIMGERHPDTIGFATLRGGDVVGDHTVSFLGDGERVEITHKASGRDTFAKGAIKAAKFLQGKNAGLYDMEDVLGLKPLHHLLSEFKGRDK
ncbi:MAG: 4-hydroxy-tetrahydrodipicolinate reductase [Ferrovum sp. 37-45-19]|uniref:4-hydroxy-tetrahydrodipicolinate reductase n=1 Tax=Ferrovum sp. JA12 TaxID=1356299 RepID=UPI000702E2F4|nr:4-hydroxy-tetrahydrodipicolinate reductase [Ferrovum sp. JA12]OYV79691.1 MAG: 4-hydroxy-tetrahydrodipicolinate reductase [Ferrovum sp. 21-44-67]OYV94327.1 MAG: 4-hydroxy-tetrahydrodipicolinate reductase [Ferrovum sp. 37-45-19]OZB32370.1 MAG: 4-hydroxy-tetrahydrodipicolinate reductase [Ferrovum sp. 34-44-207]HQT80581.1 4-hydroxy-tetrahydrodipicolinate reductase [Ferrovaceae bacterium]KRH79670.1 4-hydroxy-tetrahydrodipicolinate reductase [Ferrovum sp. JA12]